MKFKKIYFDTYLDADKLKMECLRLMKLYGFISIDDYYDLAGLTSWEVHKKACVWNDYKSFAKSKIKKRFLRKKYYIKLPKPNI